MYYQVFMHVDCSNLFIDDHLFYTQLVFALDCNRLFLQPIFSTLPGWTSIKLVMLWLLIKENILYQDEKLPAVKLKFCTW